MKKFISLIAVALTVGISGCKKDYLSLENNPNLPSVTTPDLLLPAAEVGTAANYQTGYGEYAVWDGYWTTSGNYTPNPAVNEYQIVVGDFDVWDEIYANMANWNDLESLSIASGAVNYEAIAKIMLVYNFEELVDNYNDVPYSQAFNTKNITPAYDTGLSIYHDLGKQLDAAIALINTSAATPSGSDVIFAGDMTKWAQFANTLKLRLAVRVYMKEGTSDPLVTDLANANTSKYGYLSADAAVQPGYASATTSSGGNQENPFYGDYGFDVTGNPTGNNVYYRANAYAVSFYNNTNDPRLTQYYVPATQLGYVRGNVFGDITHNEANPYTSAIGPGLLQSAAQAAPLLPVFESDFLQAEAINAGLLTTGSAETEYEAGITASFVEAGLTAAQAATYYGQSQANVGWTASTNKEQAIITQKWAAMNGWFALEAYNEYRRTGYPALPTSIDPSAIGQNLPTRIPYPTSELSTNGANLAKEGTINPLTSKIFWAK
jgi:hypothetical protein